MGVLRCFERVIATIVEGLFRFGSKKEPGELAVMLEHMVSSSAQRIPDATFVPNNYTIKVPENWYVGLGDLVGPLQNELREHVEQYCAARGYNSVGRVSVRIEPQRQDGRFHLTSTYYG